MFFRLACEKLNNQMRVPEMVDTLSLDGTDFPYIDTTRDILDIVSVHITRGSNTSSLEYVSPDKAAAIQAAGTGNTPRYFTTKGNIIELAPEPASTDAIEVVYYLRQESVLNDGGTNAFVSYYESATLYLVLAELYRSLHDSVRSAEYGTMAQALIDEANLFAWQRRYPARLSIKNI
jgi:hypothetical protein